ncbi:hypothetical protein [Dyadobacter sp. CY356]|uniref:hypothetical protein n=1 Tax=Dyadobacter sp. CY356 TaxID=2906442 RepID=UPI001F23280A|nr:hypothetical protein [Dyadobacter sp. CY356]MCF0058525.1 hypothetical protein [Dyadobacter sp. CY356]
MRIVFIFFLILSSISLFGQNYIIPKGEYMDTTLITSPNCSPPYTLYYYDVKAKYPDGSLSILNDTKQYLKKTNNTYVGTGYITFRFFINCEGVISRTKVMQTDENYKVTHFEKKFINDLYGFLLTMDKWKKNPTIYDIKNANYLSFVSFKIKNGEVIAIIP